MDLKELLGDAYKENMTLTDITAALKDKNLVDPSTLPESVAKSVFDKTASELAEVKKKFKEKLTTDEQTAAQQKEIQEQIANLQKENSQFKLKEQFLSGGYDAKTAAAMAEAVSSGDMAKFATLNTSFMADQKKGLEASIKADLLKNTPGLQGGGTGGEQGGNEPSLGEKAAQAYNSQFVQAPTNPAGGAPQGK